MGNLLKSSSKRDKRFVWLVESKQVAILTKTETKDILPILLLKNNISAEVRQTTNKCKVKLRVDVQMLMMIFQTATCHFRV